MNIDSKLRLTQPFIKKGLAELEGFDHDNDLVTNEILIKLTITVLRKRGKAMKKMK